MSRERHGKARIEPLDDLADLLFMYWVDVRVDQADCERLDARIDQVLDDPFNLLHVDSSNDIAASVQTLDGLAGIRQQRWRIWLDHDDPASEGSRCL